MRYRSSYMIVVAAAAAFMSICGPAAGQDPLELEEYTEETAEFAALFRLTNRMMLSAGYRQFKYRREDDGVTQTVTVTGPAVGLNVGIL